MPTYDYRCAKCEPSFEDFKSIAERNTPCDSPCPSCKKKKCVVREMLQAPCAAVDTTLGPGTDFKNIMKKMQKGVPKRYRENLDQAASRRGGVWGTG